MNSIQALSKIVDELEHRVATLEAKLNPVADDMEKLFDDARKLYPGLKRACGTEYDNFKRKHKDWHSVVPLLIPAIENQIAYKLHLKRTTEKTWPWKHFQTWINQRVWEAEIPAMKSAIKIERCKCGKNLNSGERQDGICMECKFKGDSDE